jgi:NMD protein affecting ribosome stability and mRNA decay
MDTIQIECIKCGIYIDYLPDSSDMKLCDDCLEEEFDDTDLKIKSYQLGEIITI